jgi:upstream activation factor subunit UAF30
MEEFIDSRIAAEQESNSENSEEDTNESDNESQTGEDLPPKKRKIGGFGGPVQLSTELSIFLGGEISLPRTEVTKRIWAYIKENNLQNPLDKREIICDEKMEALFKKKKFGMFKMTKFLAAMMKSVSELQDDIDTENLENKKSKAYSTKSVKKAAKSKQKKAKVNDKPKSNTGFHAHYRLSPALSELLNVQEESRPQVENFTNWETFK